MGGYLEVVMRRLLSLVAVGALLAACGGPAGNGGPTGGPETAGPGAPTDAGDGGSAGRPSGARVRIVNVYNGGPTAASIDVYAAPWVLDGATPLLTVPYGTASEFFDPTVADDQGNMFLSFYRHGETGNGTEVMSQTETLKGGEVITYVLMSDAEARDDGTPKLYLQALFHGSTGGVLAATAAPGNGVILVNMHGLEPAVAKPADGGSWFMSTGVGCTKAIGNDEFTLDAAWPGDGTRYELAAGRLHPLVPPVPGRRLPQLLHDTDARRRAGQGRLGRDHPGRRLCALSHRAQDDGAVPGEVGLRSPLARQRRRCRSSYRSNQGAPSSAALDRARRGGRAARRADLAALAGGFRGAGPVGLGEHRVERLDVGLDRGRDDVRARGRWPLVQAGGAVALGAGRRLDRDDHEALGLGALGERVDVVADEPGMALEHVGEGAHRPP